MVRKGEISIDDISSDPDLINNRPGDFIIICFQDEDGGSRVTGVYSPLPVVFLNEVRERDGLRFTAYHTRGDADKVADNEEVDILLVVGSERDLNAKVTVITGGDAEIRVFEDPIYSDAGTEITVRNKNSSFALTKLSKGTISFAPTLSNDGEEIFSTIIPGGSSFDEPEETFRPGGSSFMRNLFLNKNSETLIRVKNVADELRMMSIVFDFYEELE